MRVFTDRQQVLRPVLWVLRPVLFVSGPRRKFQSGPEASCCSLLMRFLNRVIRGPWPRSSSPLSPLSP
ncbi:unnamed protein product [Boreogadus saida]